MALGATYFKLQLYREQYETEVLLEVGSHPTMPSPVQLISDSFPSRAL